MRAACRVVVMVFLIGGDCALSRVASSRAEPLQRIALPATGTAGQSSIAWGTLRRAGPAAAVRASAGTAGLGRADGREIELSVIRHLASQPERQIGSLFVNFGGPGVAGVPKVKELGAALDKLGRGRFDVVSWDPRGTGESDHVVCFDAEHDQQRFWGHDWSIPTTRAEARRYLPKTVAFAQRCAARSGELLAHISTADTVCDLDYLRQLVGEQQLTYRGISYGTFLGQTYANMFQSRVRAMVLDGLVDAIAFTSGVAPSIASGITDANAVFDRFQALCQSAGPLRCTLAGKTPVALRVQRLLARLRRAPIPAPLAHPPGKLTLGDTLIVLWLMLGSPTQWPDLATALDEAARGDGSKLESMAREAKPFLQAALVPAVALQCADKPPPTQGPQAWPGVIDRLSGISFISGPLNGWFLWAPCASWKVSSAQRYTGPWNAYTETPILVIGTRFDPNTAFANAGRAARQLGNAILLIHDGYGHTSDADRSACIERATGAYLVDLVAPPDRMVCPSDRLPVDPNFGEPLP